MAFVTITWNYGDTSTIDGFRVYRDDILRYETNDIDIRTYEDDVSSYDNLRAVYKVVAFDKLQRESTRCSQADVELTYLLTPAMTSQNTPSGNALATQEGACTTDEGWVYFNGLDEGIYWAHLEVATGVWQIEVSFEFDSEAVVSRWGWTEHIYYVGGSFADMAPDDFKLYSEDVDGNRTLLDARDASVDYANGTNRVFDLGFNVSSKKFVFSAKGNRIDANMYIQKISQILLYGKPQ